jgi:two-component system NtrC family sensor kinase
MRPERHRKMTNEITILCVDDEPSILSSIKRLFLDDNYAILTAGSGEEGLEILGNMPVQIVISDGRMQGMKGSEFLKEVSRQWPETVRIALSGHADPASIVAAINEGQIYRFLPKPWSDVELKMTVANAVEKYLLVKRNRELTEDLWRQHGELERLLRENTEALNVRTGMLAARQNILDAVPAGILGLDLDDTIVLCNARWAEISGNQPVLLEPAAKVLPASAYACIQELKQKGKVARTVEINNIPCHLLGVLMSVNNQKGIILTLIRKDDLPQG